MKNLLIFLISIFITSCSTYSSYQVNPNSYTAVVIEDPITYSIYDNNLVYWNSPYYSPYNTVLIFNNYQYQYYNWSWNTYYWSSNWYTWNHYQNWQGWSHYNNWNNYNWNNNWGCYNYFSVKTPYNYGLGGKYSNMDKFKLKPYTQNNSEKSLRSENTHNKVEETIKSKPIQQYNTQSKPIQSRPIQQYNNTQSKPIQQQYTQPRPIQSRPIQKKSEFKYKK